MLATAPAVFETDRFLGYGVAQERRVTPGDHLQTAWQLWLPGHRLARGEAPWLDPYSFQPVVEPRVNFAGWPFALVFGPLEALFGTVAGWNLFVLLTYVGAGGFAALWLRSLGLGLGPALVGGLAFALAPYRVAQSTGHLLGPVSILLPLALYGIERRLGWLAVAALASIPLSGQVHLALGAIPFALAYAVVRGRWRLGLVSAGTAVAGGILVWALTLRDAVERPFSEVERYSATLLDFVRRDPGEFERFVYLGWLLPLAALAGLGLCWINTSAFGRRLGLVLGLGALVPCLLALGSNLPGYGFIWRNTPLGSTRVPERLMPIACLCLAALAAHAVACVGSTQARSRLAVALAAGALVVADLWVPLYDPLNADPANPVYAQVADAPPGRLLETPVLPPDAYAGSVHLYYAMQAPRERPLGYATSAPPAAFAAARALPQSAGALGVSVVVEYRDGVPHRVRLP